VTTEDGGRMSKPLIWAKQDVATVAEYAGVPADTVKRIVEIMEFCESMNDVPVAQSAAFGTAPVRFTDSAIVVSARAGEG
jgi:hypothetical protein